MSRNSGVTRRSLLTRVVAGVSIFTFAGCKKLSESTVVTKVLGFGERASYKAHRLLFPRKAMAQEFKDADRSPQFRSNGCF